MKVLIVTKIFPNAVEPHTCPFNRQQFRALSEYCKVDVLATIPWFPGISLLKRWSSAGALTGVPSAETIDELSVQHPRFFYIPKLGATLSGPLYAASLVRHVAQYRAKVNVVLGSWAYPDGFAAVLLAQMLGVPSVVKLHGSDINVLGEAKGPRFMLTQALKRADRVVAVSRALGEKVERLGVPSDCIDVVLNGVNTSLFRPIERHAARATLGLPREAPIIVYVGRLEPEKGVLDLLSAFERLRKRQPDAQLLLVGRGSAQAQCAAYSDKLAPSVHLVGPQPLQHVPLYMAASDIVTLPSWNEGTPNVVLEAMACGRRVVATAVGGTPALIDDTRVGALVPPKAPELLADALLQAIRTPYHPGQVASRCRVGSWSDSAGQLYQSLKTAVSNRGLPHTSSRLVT